MKWLVYCQEPANAHSSMRQVPCVLRRDATCAAAAAHARDAVETTASSDSIWMVARASAVPRSAAAVLIVVAPAALVAPARKHHLADVSAGVRWAATVSRSLLARSQRLRCGSSSRALGLAEVVCPTERSASAAVAAAPDDARRSTSAGGAVESPEGAGNSLGHRSSMCFAGANPGFDGG